MQDSIIDPTLFLLYINDLPHDVICNIAIHVDDTTVYSKYDKASDMWRQLELAFELESDLRDTMDWGWKWLVDFNAWKIQLASFDRSNNSGAIDMKMDGPVLGEKSSFKILGSTFSPKLNWDSYIISLEPWFVLWRFFLLRLLCVSKNLPCGHAWNTVVMSGLVLPVATWNC